MMEQTDSGINLSGKQECNNDLVDRISDLPDSILSAILSLLPTKEAVSTVLVSKRWKFVWRTVHTFDFYHSRPLYDFSDSLPPCDHEDEDIKFIEFVDRVLHLHDGGRLNKFRLYWETDCDSVLTSHANSWINTAIIRNVHTLSLEISGPYDFPTSAFSCDSLRSLTLSSKLFYVSKTLEVCLPRLESLICHEVEFESEAAYEKLIYGCPMLSKLSLGILNDAFKCIISSASLRCLTLYFYKKVSLTLNASSVEYLSLGGGIREIFVEKSLSSLVEAEFNLWRCLDDDFSYNSIVEGIRVFHCAKVLTLSPGAVQALTCATISLSTEFKRLVELVATTSRSLQDFIRSSDNLQVLEIKQDPDEKLFHKIHSKWSTLVEVPRCLSNCLKKVTLYYYKCDEDDFEMIRYLLEHGSALEAVEIFVEEVFDWRQDMFELTQKISEFPRKSPVCKVRIS